ncbi:hypothetical protein [Streptomyces zhihengii]|uniref:Uncharacterized protein n=1 Tax=Streptomyces zhihengii TaxID=1818004 RepID=A0ABS2V3C1_9ACTN|nr:hypothetical protein [Streptomyces zhihengii]MBM9624351.1 hypothetical protein [Streptomyces zhihengii]
MIEMSVDTTSTSWAAGQAMGTLLMTAAISAIVWRCTRGWRRADLHVAAAAKTPLAELRVRRRRTVAAVLAGIAVLGLVKVGFDYRPEARSAVSGTDPGVAAGAWPDRRIDPPGALGQYRLKTGEEAALYAALARGGETEESGRRTWYYGTAGQEVAAVLSVNTVEGDPGLAREKQQHSPTNEFRNFFAGAEARETAFFDAGPLPGRLGCGLIDTPDGADASLCAWTDAYTFGTLMLTDTLDLGAAARVTRDLRAATDHRS